MKSPATCGCRSTVSTRRGWRISPPRMSLPRRHGLRSDSRARPCVSMMPRPRATRIAASSAAGARVLRRLRKWKRRAPTLARGHVRDEPRGNARQAWGVTGITYRYRADVLRQLSRHGVQPRPTTPPDLVHEFVSDLYRYELRRLRDRLVRG